MKNFSIGALAMLVAALVAAHTSSTNALTMKECSAKYKEAQTAKTLNGMSWADFRKANCGSTATTQTKSEPAAKGTEPSKQTQSTKGIEPSKGAAVFPTSLSSKYASETPGKARLHTCLDQYKANKATNGNGGLVWIQKGGGYYSECNKRLKG
jgi:hypothetical protein